MTVVSRGAGPHRRAEAAQTPSGGRRQARRPTWSRRSDALRLFLSGATVRTAWKVAAVVGTVLSAVNQGSVLAAGEAGPATWARVGVNYLVPFLVSSVGFLSACRELPEGEERSHGQAGDA